MSKKKNGSSEGHLQRPLGGVTRPAYIDETLEKQEMSLRNPVHTTPQNGAKGRKIHVCLT